MGPIFDIIEGLPKFFKHSLDDAAEDVMKLAMRGGPSWLDSYAAMQRINPIVKIKLQTCYSLALSHQNYLYNKPLLE